MLDEVEIVFKQLENATEKDVNITAFCSLAPSWRALLDKLQSAPIILLTYGDIPPLFESAMLESISEVAEGRGFDHVSFDLHELPRAQPILFLVSSYAPISMSEILLQTTKHLVESGGKARFIVVFSTRSTSELRQHACFPFLKSYIKQFETVSQDPLSFLSQFTRLGQVPTCAERNLWKVLFYGTVMALEQTVLDEEQFRQITSGLRLIETDESQSAFYEWDKLPPRSRLASLYFESSDFTGADESLGRSDETFYLAKCFRHFCDVKLLSAVQDVMTTPQAVGQFHVMTQLREQESASQHAAEAVKFWQMLGIRYLLGESEPPTRFIGPLDEHVRSDPNVRRSVERIGETLGSCSPFEDRWSPVEAARTAFDHLYTIVASQRELDVSAMEVLLDSFLAEYERGLDEYEEVELVQLVQKTVNVSLMIYACLSLHEEPLSGQGFGLFRKLWSQCFDRLGASLFLSNEQREKLWQSLRTLTLFDQRFREVARQLFSRGQEIEAIRVKTRQALSSEVPLENFFALFADQLREHDFFLDLREWTPLALPLAKSYSELDEQLLHAQLPFSLEYQRKNCICELISNAQVETEYDRIFVLIIDSLSYLEWKLIKHHFEDLADEDIHVSERYAFAPIPTHTPANTTCLITGFAPSEIGVCGWNIKPIGQNAIDLKDEAALQIIKDIGLALNPRHSLTLVHNHIGSNLTRLWMALAKIEEIAIPTTESRKAVAQVREQIYQLDPANRVTVVYIADFDEAGHWHLRIDGWNEYYSLLATRIKESLLLPIFRRAKKREEKTLAVLTADHGKLSRYESKMVGLVVPSSDAFSKCIDILDKYDVGRSARHIVAWVPDGEIDGIEGSIQQAVENQTDVIAYFGEAVSRFFPMAPKTNLTNPNVVILSRFGLSHVMGHGAGSLSEVVVPAVRFSWG